MPCCQMGSEVVLAYSALSLHLGLAEQPNTLPRYRTQRVTSRKLLWQETQSDGGGLPASIYSPPGEEETS